MTVEELKQLQADKARLEWIMPILSLTDAGESLVDSRMTKLAGALLLGQSGREAIDTARESKS